MGAEDLSLRRMDSDFDSDESDSDTSSGAPEEGETGSETRFWEDIDPSNPTGYVRDPHRLVTYLIPFPKPTLVKADPSTMPERFLIYTPPPPSLLEPDEGVHEHALHKVRRKWQQQIRDAKTSTAKTASWHGIKSNALKGISWAGDKSTNSNVDFLRRVKHNHQKQNQQQEPQHEHAEEEGEEEDVVVEEEDTTEKTDRLEELVLVYPPSTGVVEEAATTDKNKAAIEEFPLVHTPTMGLNPDQMREEFVNTMLRAKTKAQRDAIISTALLPVIYGIDIAGLVLGWTTVFLLPAAYLSKVDTVWAINSIRAARIARALTKRLSPSESEEGEGNIRMSFVPSEGVEVMGAYLLNVCQRRNPKLFPGSDQGKVTEEDVLRAIAWRPSERAHNSKDEQRELTDAKLDLKTTMKKGAKEWIRWCKYFQRSPTRAARH